MNPDFRNRAFLPIVVPLAILLAIAAGIGLIALLLLYSTRETAVALAIVIAAGILVATALAATRDRLDSRQKSAISIAVLTPIVAGAAFATGVVGNIPAEELNINREPHEEGMVLAQVPPEAPVLAAESLDSFCLPTDGGCEPTREWEIPYGGEEEFLYAFDNRDTGTPHNLYLYELEDLSGATEEPISIGSVSEDQLLTPEPPPTFAGPAAQAYRFTPEGEVPEQLYFVCTVHASTMFGVATITDG